MSETPRDRLNAVKENIAELIAHGLSDQEIADHLATDPSTAEPYELIAVIRDLM